MKLDDLTCLSTCHFVLLVLWVSVFFFKKSHETYFINWAVASSVYHLSYLFILLYTQTSCIGTHVLLHRCAHIHVSCICNRPYDAGLCKFLLWCLQDDMRQTLEFKLASVFGSGFSCSPLTSKRLEHLLSHITFLYWDQLVFPLCGSD